MARVLGPGGRIALIDTDWQTAIVHPADSAVVRRMFEGFVAQSANPFAGRQLRGLLAGAGLEIVEEAAATWIEPQDGHQQFMAALRGAAEASGVISQQEAERFSSDIEAAAGRGAFHMSVTMYGVAALKPA